MLRNVAGVLGGHAWTILADARHRLSPVDVPTSEPWAHTVRGDDGEAASLTGRYASSPSLRDAVLIVHGLGGSSQSGYCRGLARAAADRGWSSLRIDLRGASGDGQDVYHAGLAQDLRAALQSPEIAEHDRLYVVGVSLGGHATLRLALEPLDRLAAVVALSAPLDLAASCQAIDRRRAFPYRHHVLGALKDSYRAVVARHEAGLRVPSPLETVEAVRTIRDWDRTVVVPRFGFADVADYHRSMSVGPRLRDLACPALYVGSPFDPMVPGPAVLPSLSAAGDSLRTIMLERGGHIGVPA
ncbi:MAG: alpha/beta fold hydrolase, partial [Nannocystaceae bacterium]|nr:alpha/beta fold hydrolase [Nannocystaceae bacterium]